MVVDEQEETALRTILNMTKECNCAYPFRMNRKASEVDVTRCRTEKIFGPDSRIAIN